MKLTEIYERVLEALHIKAGPEGLLSYEALDGPLPLTVNMDGKEKRLVLPTQQVLTDANWNDLVPFHPLSEHLNRGTSQVQNTIVKIGILRLTEVLSSLMSQLSELAADKSRHASMSPKSQRILSVLPNIDKKTVEAISEIIRRVDMTPQRRLISMFLKRNGVYKGVNSRVCVVTVPLLDELTNSDHKIWGVKVRVKDIEAIEALIDYILPDADQVETYSAPSDSKAAPYFESFLDAYEKVVTQLNKVINENKKELVMVEKLKTNINWGNISEDLLTHRAEIPSLEGNKGVVINADSQTDTSQMGTTVTTPPPSRTAAHPAMVPAPVIQATPVVATAPQQQVSTQADEGESLASKMAKLAARNGQVQHPQMMAPAPMPMMAAPQQPVYQMAAPAPMMMPMQQQQPQMAFNPQTQQVMNVPPGYAIPQGWIAVMQTPNGLVPVAQGGGMMQGGGGFYNPNGPVQPTMMQQQPLMQTPAWMGSSDGRVVGGATPVQQQVGGFIAGQGGMLSGGAGLLGL